VNTNSIASEAHGTSGVASKAFRFVVVIVSCSLAPAHLATVYKSLFNRFQPTDFQNDAFACAGTAHCNCGGIVIIGRITT
jgi:hypothetical protein